MRRGFLALGLAWMGAGLSGACSITPTFVDDRAAGGGGGHLAGSTGPSGVGSGGEGGIYTPECTSPIDCPGLENECAHLVCAAHTCGVAFEPDGFVLGVQTGGDCKRAVCDGTGSVRQEVFPSDLPIDGRLCTDDVCTEGVPSNPNLPADAQCGMAAPPLLCDGNGACVGCAADGDCGGSVCTTYACKNSECVGQNLMFGEGDPGGQLAGDCLLVVCNGTGSSATIADDTDIPDDGDPCTDDLCNAGSPSNPPIAGLDDGSACTKDTCNGGVVTHTAITPVSDMNKCTTDTCDPATGLTQYVPRPDGTSCGPCNAFCSAGVCEAGGCAGNPQP